MDDDRNAALQLLGCLLTRPLDFRAARSSRAVADIDITKLAERLAECEITVLNPASADDAAHLNAIAAIFADLIDNGLALSQNAPPDVIDCIIANVKP